MELFHKLTAVLLCNTCKLHCTKEDLPSATVTICMSLPPLFQAILNGFFIIKRVALVAQLNLFRGKPHPLQDGFAFARSLSTDVFSEEDSVPLTHCNGDKRRDTSELTLQLTTPSATAQLPCSASHEQNTSTHAHSQCTGCERTGSLSLTAASGLLWTTSISPAHTPTDRGGWGAWHQKAFSHTYTNTALIFMYTQNTHPDTQHACLWCHVMSCM